LQVLSIEKLIVLSPTADFHGIVRCVALFNILIITQQKNSSLAADRSGEQVPSKGFREGTMNLEILTPEKKLYSGEVYGVQMPGISGSFEVLDRHAPLVSALKAGRVKVLKDKQNHFAYFDIQGGFVEVLNNKVTLLAEGATPVETA
jgi:F-type H+-transporting ATPase subunit epsilon